MEDAFPQPPPKAAVRSCFERFNSTNSSVDAQENVELAVLSAIEHGQSPDGPLAARIASAAILASADIDADHEPTAPADIFVRQRSSPPICTADLVLACYWQRPPLRHGSLGLRCCSVRTRITTRNARRIRELIER
jgi:hypothetical protein